MQATIMVVALCAYGSRDESLHLSVDPCWLHLGGLLNVLKGCRHSALRLESLYPAVRSVGLREKKRAYHSPASNEADSKNKQQQDFQAQSKDAKGSGAD